MKTPEEWARQIMDFIFPDNPLLPPIRRDMAGLAAIIRAAVEEAVVPLQQRIEELDADVERLGYELQEAHERS